MFKMLLHDSWTVGLAADGGRADVPAAVRDRIIPAAVPGCVHTDLLAADLIPDPYVAGNDLAMTWIGRCDWRYTTRFDAPAEALAHERIELVCDGLDTVATLTLNGVEIGRAENMHLARRFDIRSALRPTDNELTIRFGSPLAYAEAQRDRLGDLPATGNGSNPPLPHNFIRKMSCNFGWDWGPALVTAGIWRPIRIEAWSDARVEAVRPLVSHADDEQARLELRIDTAASGEDAAAPIDLGYELLDPAGERVACDRLDARAGGTAVAMIDVDRPQLWWPVGHGEQPLYTLRVTLKDARGDVAQQLEHRLGLRTVELVTTPDDEPWGDPVPGSRGETFHLKVNGRRVYCKGANWIPDDCFPSRVTAERCRKRIEQAKGANMNMLRVWGGGLYESHDFYDVCDELGIMVWQDFCFACALYPEEEPFASTVAAEAKDNIARLARHSSLVIWNGCNENIWGTFDWEDVWRNTRLEGKRTWGLNYYLDLLPRLIEQVDGSRPYWPASPYSGSMDVHPNANESGNRHIWDVWHGPGEYRNYLAHYPRMASEFGFHGPPCWPTLARVIPEGERRWDGQAMRHHNKNSADRDGQLHSNERMADDFVPPAPEGNFDDWLYLAQIMQARAVDMGVSWFRALSPWNSGALYWQLNDCWPAASWSAIDGEGRLKPLWYASRRFFAPRLVTIKPQRVAVDGQADSQLAVYLHNDAGQPWRGDLRIRQLTLDGDVLNETTQPVNVAARQTGRVLVPDAFADRPDAMLAAELGDLRATWYFRSDKQLVYPEPAFDATLQRDGDVHRLTVHARSLLRDVCIFVDRLDADATISDQFVTLLPGDAFTFEIRSDRPLTREALTLPPVFQCANRFGAEATAGALAADDARADA